MGILTTTRKKIIAAVSSLALVATGLLATNVAAQGATIPNVSCDTNGKIFDTAWNGSTGVLSSGTDRNWQVGQIINNTGTPFVLDAVSPPYSAAAVVATPPSTKWYVPSGTKYISKVASAAQEPATGWTIGGTNFKSDIFYSFEFTLDGRVNPADFKITGNIFADNSIYDIYVNGVSQRSKVANLPSAPAGSDPYTYTGYQSTLPTTVALPNDWVNGTNTLVVQVLSGMAYYGMAADFSYVAPCTSSVPVLNCTSNPNMFNTAWNGQYGRLTSGTDGFWKVQAFYAANTPTNAPTTGYSPAVVVSSPPTAWAVLSNATWIAPNSGASQTGSTTTTDPTFRSNFFFKYDFEIEEGLNPATFSLTAKLFADNAVTEIYVNGVAQSTAGGGTVSALPAGGADPYTYSLGYKAASATQVVLDQNWASGLNSLVIKVASGMPKLGMAGVFTPSISCATPPPTPPTPVSVDKAVAICVEGSVSTVEISGTGFTANSTVTIGGLAATVISQTETQLVVAMPEGAASGLLDVEVTDGQQTATGASFYSNACPNTPDPLAIVSAELNCENGAALSISVTGEGMTENAVVEIQGIEATVLSRTANTIVVEVPDGLSTPPLDITLIDGSQSFTGEGMFTGVCPPETPPTIVLVEVVCDKLNPDTIRITGENFTANTTVLIGGVSAEITSLTGSTVILAKIPADLPIGSTTVSVVEGSSQFDKLDAFYNGCVCTDSDGDYDWDSEDGDGASPSPKPKVDLNGDCNGYGWAFGCDNGYHYGYETTQSPDPGGDNDHIIVSNGEPTGSDNVGPADGSSNGNGKGRLKRSEVETIQVLYFSITDPTITHADCPDPGDGIGIGDDEDDYKSPKPSPSRTPGDDDDHEGDDDHDAFKCQSPSVPGEPSEEPRETEQPKVDLNGDCNGYGWAFGCNNGNHYGYETTQSPDPGGDNDHTVVSDRSPSAAPTQEPTPEPSVSPSVDPAVSFPAPEVVVSFTPVAKASAKVESLTEKLSAAKTKLSDLKKAKASKKAVKKAKATVAKIQKQLVAAKKTLKRLSK